MGPPAKVNELPLPVKRDGLSALHLKILKELHLVGLIPLFEKGYGLIYWHLESFQGHGLLGKLFHPLFYAGKVFW